MLPRRRIDSKDLGVASRGRSVVRDRWILVILLLAIWQLVVSSGIVSSSLVASPSSTVVGLVHLFRQGDLLSAFGQTLLIFLVAFAIATAGGTVAGIAVGYWKGAYDTVRPIVSAVNAVPKLVFLPVFVLLLGIGVEMQIGYAVLSAVTPVILTVASGVRNVQPLLIESAKSLGAGKRDLFVKVVLPAAWPSVRTAVWYAQEYALLAVVLTELFISPVGIGHTVELYTAQSRPEDVFGILLALTAAATAASLVARRRFEE